MERVQRRKRGGAKKKYREQELRVAEEGKEGEAGVRKEEETFVDRKKGVKERKEKEEMRARKKRLGDEKDGKMKIEKEW